MINAAEDAARLGRDRHGALEGHGHDLGAVGAGTTLTDGGGEEGCGGGGGGGGGGAPVTGSGGGSASTPATPASDPRLLYVRQPVQHSAHPVAAPRHRITDAALRRLRKEFRWAHDEHIEAFGPTDLSMSVWLAVIKGPRDTPYEGGTFVFEFVIPGDYPFRPPKVRLLTRCYHPGVTATGCDPGCLDVTKDNWSPALTIPRLVLSYISLLAAPNADDPLEVEVAAVYKSDKPRFDATAAEWTRRFATMEEGAVMMSAQPAASTVTSRRGGRAPSRGDDSRRHDGAAVTPRSRSRSGGADDEVADERPRRSGKASAGAGDSTADPGGPEEEPEEEVATAAVDKVLHEP